METKVCTKCKRELPVTEFHKYNRRGNKYYSSCRDCKAEYKKANKDKLLIAQYKRRANPTAEDKAKRKAWNKMYYALKVGKIDKPETCDLCNRTENIQAHHMDYNKLFEITWVCQYCHVELDKQRRSA